MKRSLTLVASILLFTVQQASGKLGAYIPKFIGYSGNLSFDGRYSIDDSEGTDGRVKKDHNKKYRETLDVETMGYIYHPSLLFFKMKMSGELERESQLNGDGQWNVNKGENEEYTINGLVLANKPLNLDFTVSMRRPFDSYGMGSSSNVSNIFEAETNLNYRSLHNHATLSYLYYSSKSEDSYSAYGGGNVTRHDDVTTLRGNISRNNEKYAIAGTLSHQIRNHDNGSVLKSSATTPIIGDRTVTDQIMTEGELTYKRYTFHNSAEYSISSTHDNTVDDEILSEKWEKKKIRQVVDIDLPWNMDSQVVVLVDRADNENRNVGNGGDWQVTYNENQNFDGVLHHHLFDSVRSVFGIGLHNRHSENDHNFNQSYNASVNYSKKLFGGGIQANIDNRYIIDQQQGTPDYTDILGNDLNQVDFAGSSFDINRGDVVVSSLRVGVCDVDGTNIAGEVYSCDCYTKENPTCSSDIDSQLWQALPSNKYSVTQNVGITRLTIDPTAVVAGTDYDLRASYKLPKADYTTLSNTSSFMAKISLFDDALSSTYRHSFTKEKFLKGDGGYENLTPEVTLNYIGVLWHKAPFSLQGHYNMLDGDNFTERRLFGQGRYSDRRKINRNMILSWGCKYSNESVKGEDGASVAVHNTRRLLHTNLGLSGLIPLTNMRYSAGTSYSQNRGSAPEYQINNNGLWQNIVYDDLDTDNYSSNLKINGIIPITGFRFELSMVYSLSQNLDNKIDTTTKGYLVKTERSWKFGGTTLSISGDYHVSESWGEVKISNVDTHTKDTEANVLVKLKRSLF